MNLYKSPPWAHGGKWTHPNKAKIHGYWFHGCNYTRVAIMISAIIFKQSRHMTKKVIILIWHRGRERRSGLSQGYIWTHMCDNRMKIYIICLTGLFLYMILWMNEWMNGRMDSCIHSIFRIYIYGWGMFSSAWWTVMSPILCLSICNDILLSSSWHLWK